MIRRLLNLFKRDAEPDPLLLRGYTHEWKCPSCGRYNPDVEASTRCGCCGGFRPDVAEYRKVKP